MLKNPRFYHIPNNGLPMHKICAEDKHRLQILPRQGVCQISYSKVKQLVVVEL
jgi:hypothetical protein